MPYEHLTSANDARLAPYARVRDADLAAWPDAPAGLFMAESRAVIAAAVEAVRDRVVVIGLLETLEYLVRGGRLSAAAGAVGTLLNVKPVVAVEDGLIVQLGKARGSKNGRNLLNQKVEKAGGIDFSMPLALGYTGLSDAVLKKYIEDSAALWAGHTEGELPVHTIGATIGTHVGPGAVAVAFFQPAN